MQCINLNEVVHVVKAVVIVINVHSNSPKGEVPLYLRRTFLNLSHTDGKKKVKRLFLYELIPELSDLSKASFYSYKGSLTTPPCYQSVRWIVLKTPIAATKRDVRSLFSCNKIHLYYNQWL